MKLFSKRIQTPGEKASPPTTVGKTVCWPFVWRIHLHLGQILCNLYQSLGLELLKAPH